MNFLLCRLKTAIVVARMRIFDMENVRTEIGQVPGAKRRSYHLRKVDYPDTFKYGSHTTSLLREDRGMVIEVMIGIVTT